MDISNKTISRNAIKNIIGIFVGALAGYLYYFYIGCSSGTCPLTSNPLISTLWGAVMGYLLFDLFKLKQKATPPTDQA